MRRAYFALPLLFIMLACGDSDLQKIAKGLDITAKSIGTLQTTVIEANKAGVLSDDDTRAVLQVCLEVSQAGKDAVAITRGLAQLDDPSKVQILSILKPVIKAVDAAVGRTLLFDDETALTNIRAILLTVQSTLNGIQVILEVQS